MPRQDLLSPEVFYEKIDKYFPSPSLPGWRKKIGFEFREDRDRLGLVPPSQKSVHSEVGYQFEWNGYKAIGWTSYVPALGYCRRVDMLHVLIVQGDRILYKTRELRRAGNFSKRFLSYCWIAMWRVFYRHRCPHCGGYMDIHNRKYRQYWWQCDKKEHHSDGKVFKYGWDHNLPPKAKAFLEEMRKPGQQYRDKLRKAGKPTFMATKKRIGKRWKQTKPWNRM